MAAKIYSRKCGTKLRHCHPWGDLLGSRPSVFADDEVIRTMRLHFSLSQVTSAAAIYSYPYIPGFQIFLYIVCPCYWLSTYLSCAFDVAMQHFGWQPVEGGEVCVFFFYLIKASKKFKHLQNSWLRSIALASVCAISKHLFILLTFGVYLILITAWN